MEEKTMNYCDVSAEEERSKCDVSRRVVGTVFKGIGKGIGKAGDAILSGVTTAMWETGKHAKITQLKMNLPKLQHNLQKLHTKLGEVVYEQVKQREDILKQESITNIVDQLKKCEEHMARIEAEIAEIKGEVQEAVETKIDLETLSGLARDGSDEQRYNAIAILAQLGDEETVSVLVDALGDKNPRVRLGALRGLYKLNTEESVSSILDALGDEHPDVRASAATYLGWSGNVAFSDGIAHLLKDDDEQVRKSAAIALGNLASQSAVGSLIDTLSDPDVGVRQQAVIALRRITHQFFNFRASVSEEERNRAIARWRSWWADYQRATTEEGRGDKGTKGQEEPVEPTPVEEPQARGLRLIRDRKIEVGAEVRPPPPEQTPDEPEAQASETAAEQDKASDATTSEEAETSDSEKPLMTSKKKRSRKTKKKSTRNEEV